MICASSRQAIDCHDGNGCIRARFANTRANRRLHAHRRALRSKTTTTTSGARDRFIHSSLLSPSAAAAHRRRRRRRRRSARMQAMQRQWCARARSLQQRRRWRRATATAAAASSRSRALFADRRYCKNGERRRRAHARARMPTTLRAPLCYLGRRIAVQTKKCMPTRFLATLTKWRRRVRRKKKEKMCCMTRQERNL